MNLSSPPAPLATGATECRSEVESGESARSGELLPGDRSVRNGKSFLRIQRRIESRLEEVDRLAGEIRVLMREHSLASLAFRVELVARECLNNAVLHGNDGQLSRRIDFDLSRGSRWLVLRVADEGPGIPVRARRPVKVSDDSLPSGRGLTLIRGYADRVRINRRGNAITVWFHVHRSNPNAPHATLHDRTER